MSQPYCRALVVCDTVVCDQFTDKWSLIGLLTNARAVSFPAIIAKVSCYATVSDVDGEIKAQFRIVDPELNVIRTIDVPAIGSKKSDETEFAGIFPEVIVPKPGRYSVEFSIDGQLLQTSRLDVEPIPAIA